MDIPDVFKGKSKEQAEKKCKVSYDSHDDILE